MYQAYYKANTSNLLTEQLSSFFKKLNRGFTGFKGEGLTFVLLRLHNSSQHGFGRT